MTCENKLCIYCENNKCILDKISINCIGMCEECIFINIDDDILNQTKVSMLEKFSY